MTKGDGLVNIEAFGVDMPNEPFYEVLTASFCVKCNEALGDPGRHVTYFAAKHERLELPEENACNAVVVVKLEEIFEEVLEIV